MTRHLISGESRANSLLLLDDANSDEGETLKFAYETYKIYSDEYQRQFNTSSIRCDTLSTHFFANFLRFSRPQMFARLSTRHFHASFSRNCSPPFATQRASKNRCDSMMMSAIVDSSWQWPWRRRAEWNLIFADSRARSRASSIANNKLKFQIFSIMTSYEGRDEISRARRYLEAAKKSNRTRENTRFTLNINIYCSTTLARWLDSILINRGLRII